jgi:hypothetical protein
MQQQQQQAYQLKSIKYRNNTNSNTNSSTTTTVSRRILLQNENGPCPLLAAANALLLRGEITFDPICIRNGVASTSDVVNMLADRACTNKASRQLNNNTHIMSATPESEYHLHEVLSLLPNLQHGMDVNPKFTAGVTGIEYTSNLATFDLLGLELVHGWLLDPQSDADTISVVGQKTYNELIEILIIGNDAKESIVKLQRQIFDLQEENMKKNESNLSSSIESSDMMEGSAVAAVESSIGNEIDYTKRQEERLVEMKARVSESKLQIFQSEIANNFLSSSGHQLTYHGLQQLNEYINEGSLCVFFRNNHFATITKHAGTLYLLVTDLGYANTPEIVWEKLDNIDGDTEYCTEEFGVPQLRTELRPADGPSIAPELILAQRGQSESDYQLALALSKNNNYNAATITTTRLDEEDGKLIDAVKELSIKTFHGEANATLNVSSGNSNNNANINNNTTQSSSLTTSLLETNTNYKTQIDSDHDMALAYQQEQNDSSADEQLAMRLQEMYYSQQVTNNQQGNANNNNSRDVSSSQQQHQLHQGRRVASSSRATRQAGSRSTSESSNCTVS